MHCRYENLVLVLDAEVLASQDLNQLLFCQRQELLPALHLQEVRVDVALGELHQVVTGDLLGELEKADAVQRVDLPLQELAAELHHLGELQHVGGDDQLLNVVLPDAHHPCGQAHDSGAVGQPPPRPGRRATVPAAPPPQPLPV